MRFLQATLLVLFGMSLSSSAVAQLAPVSAFEVPATIVVSSKGTDNVALSRELDARLPQKVTSEDITRGDVTHVWVSVSQRSVYLRCVASNGRTFQTTTPRGNLVLSDYIVAQLNVLLGTKPTKERRNALLPLSSFEADNKAARAVTQMFDDKGWMPYVPTASSPATSKSSATSKTESALNLGDPRSR